jgi:hypothetical protein
VKKDIRSVKERHEAELMRTPGVTGVGIGESAGKPCILVLVEHAGVKVPARIEGYAVEVQETGPLQAQILE